MSFVNFKRWLLINTRNLTTFIFPPRCVGCDTLGFDLCENCRGEINETKDPSDWVVSAAPYHDKRIKKLIWRIKYRGAYQATRSLAKILAEHLTIELADWFEVAPNQKLVVTAIPSSGNSRGFNQAEMIAQMIVQNFPETLVYEQVLEKIRTTPSQMSLSRLDRLTNLIGAFRVKKEAEVAGKNFLIIDDVATTGSTMTEARRALEEGGAKVKMGAVVAHG